MASEYVVSLPRSDSPGKSVLLHVTHHGAASLNLDIVATEGRAPYSLKLKPSRVPSLRSDKNTLSASEWEAVLAHILLHQPLPNTTDVKGLSTTAAKSSGSLELTIRTSIEGITTRLGAISLLKTEDEFDAVHCAHVAAARASTLATSLQESQSLIQSQKSQIQDLETELETLIAVRNEDEATLYSKFALTINTKKLKIRDQQRLLATAKVDPKVAAEVRALRDAVPKGIDARHAKSRTDNSKAGGRKTPSKRKGRGDPFPPPEIKDEPIISDDSTQEDLEPEREEKGRQATPTPEESDASDAEMAYAPLPTRSATRRETVRVVDAPSEEEEVDMQTPNVAVTETGVMNGTDKGKALANANVVVAHDRMNRDGGGGDDDATDEDDDDDEL